jgi:hypothetical protein
LSNQGASSIKVIYSMSSSVTAAPPSPDDGQGKPSSSRRYTASQKTMEQRRVNGKSRQFGNFMKVMQDKLRLPLDEVARLQEVAAMVKHCFSFEQVRELYMDEYEQAVAAAVHASVSPVDAELRDKAHRVAQLQGMVDKLCQERGAFKRLAARRP